MTNVNLANLEGTNEPQDVYFVGETPYEYLFANENKNFIKSVKKFMKKRAKNV